MTEHTTAISHTVASHDGTTIAYDVIGSFTPDLAEAIVPALVAFFQG
jgi:hypothetical protein